MSTYSSNDDVQAEVPFTISSTSKPSTSKIASMRAHAKSLIHAVIPLGTADVADRLKYLEVTLVKRLIDNFFALGRGEEIKDVAVTEDDYVLYQLDDFVDEATYGGGHVSVKIP